MCSQKSDVLLCTFFVTQSFFGFSWSSDNIVTTNKKNTWKKEPFSLSEITIQYWQKNIIIPLLCQCVLFTHICVSKNSVVSKDVILYLLWNKVIIYAKNLLFSHYKVFYNTGEGIEENCQSVTKVNGVNNAIILVIYFLPHTQFVILLTCCFIFRES